MNTGTLYCWPCLLFSLKTKAWNKEGLQNLESFRIVKTQHEVLQAHVNAVADIIQFRRSRIRVFTDYGLEKENCCCWVLRHFLTS